MKTKNFSNREFSAVVKDAKNEVKSFSKSPYKIINDLNKAAKKNEYCNHLPIKEVANVCKKLHSGRYAFDVCLFTKFNGKLYLSTLVDGYNKSDFMHGDTFVDAKGHEIIWSDSKLSAISLQPVVISYDGIFAAFCKVAKIDIQAMNKAKKEAEKEAKKAKLEAERAAKKAQRDYETLCKNIAKDFARGIITEVEHIEKLRAAKEAYLSNVA